ncbi:SpoIIE family protein phosphatase [Streptomyces sp. DH37]|uniref:SpoIIE family protein phosphatase n=1 Tax=Streptomyces sp. DH37 TaxID=3040122 RepID=UPI002441B53B|nr:SpoIIE family protein phosphatase [Streptomyces sp. DH37]MDG9702802.1 SpoIIE family protein phosphatase [Streptomyces sp. DH37]
MTASGVGVFAADDEIGRDLAAVDWAATPLGPPAGWPQSLRTAVSILLSSRFPMWMAWGPRLTFFCNAAYRRDTLGRKYPWALGRSANEVWAEIWDDIGPRIDTVLTTGKATWDEALLLFLERSGYPEETYHTFSYSPLRDDAGAVVGMLCVVSEETERVIGERRMATLRDLGSDPSVIRTEQETLAFAGRQLGRNPRDLPFTLTYLFQDDGSARLANVTGMPAGHPAAPATLPAGEPGGVWPAAVLARGEAALVELDGARFAGLPAGDWTEPPTQALVVPLLQQGDTPYGFLVAALNRYRPLDDNYRGFVELAAGHVAAGIASARSYQAQQRRAEELAELDRAKTAFFSNISHEFRTPLTLIMGPLEELRGRLAGADEEVREELEVIRRNGLRMGRLVNTLLDFSRIEAGRLRARFEPVDLAAVTAELASVFRSAVDRAGLAFEVDCPTLPEPVHLDRDMWEKVVLNLLSNALKFTFEGSIGVRLRAEEGQAVLLVSDTGIGVPAEELPRLFERFHRIENARARSNEGSGIGLALVKELVGLHGGTITADSVEGEGTVFTIRLPMGSARPPAGPAARAAEPFPASTAADPYLQEALRWLPRAGRDTVPEEPEEPEEPAPPAAEGAEGAPPGPGAARARVLIADDNADMREYLQRILAPNYRVTAVADGRAALEAVRADAPDLVVSDVMMPRMDGLELVAALRADSRTAGVPVLLLSARAGQEASIEGLESGADDYLVKPFSAAELLARVRAAVKLARLRNHHAQWRTALVDSLQEAFFVCDEEGAVVEINSAFTDILGYGPEGLPYRPKHPWWPDRETDPEAHHAIESAFAQIVGQTKGNYVTPVTHRDGHRLWVYASFNEVRDPDTGRRMVVGTFRDVTAERLTAQRETALAALSVRLSEAGSVPDALRAALDELRRVWRAPRALAVTWDGDGRPRPVAEAPAAAWGEPDDPVRGAVASLRGRTPLHPVATDGPAGTGITLEHPGGPLSLWVESSPERPFITEDHTLLAVLGGYLGQALQRVHAFEQQRETALTLQRAILGPDRLPGGFAVRYEPAARPLEVGGDWYDTVELPDGRIGIVVGDCVGRGLEAATVMGQLRSACRALLLQFADPAQVLTALDRFAALIPGAMCATVFCGVLDPATGRLVYSSAGHPPGILTHPDGTTELLDQGRSIPLAVQPDRPRPTGARTMPPASVLLLYTDGLVERRSRPLHAGIAEAAAAARKGLDASLEELADDIRTGLEPAGGYDDDMALLLYRHPRPLEVSFPADSAQLAPVRRTLRDWLERLEVGSRLTQAVLVAVGEACANAIEHGHRHNPGRTVRLTAGATAHGLHLVVADTGRWRTPRPEANAHRGRGLILIHALMDQVDIVTDDAGTTVEMHVRITR